MQVLDQEWVASERTYMKFNEVMSKVRMRVCAALRTDGLTTIKEVCGVLEMQVGPKAADCGSHKI